MITYSLLNQPEATIMKLTFELIFTIKNREVYVNIARDFSFAIFKDDLFNVNYMRVGWLLFSIYSEESYV